jgi:hypothetical protein
MVVVQLMRRCREHLLLHIDSVAVGVFRRGLEGGGSPRRKIPDAAVHLSAILEPEGIQSGGGICHPLSMSCGANVMVYASCQFYSIEDHT